MFVLSLVPLVTLRSHIKLRVSALRGSSDEIQECSNVKTFVQLNAASPCIMSALLPDYCRSLSSPCCAPAEWRTYAWQGSSCTAPRYIKKKKDAPSQNYTPAAHLASPNIKPLVDLINFAVALIPTFCINVSRSVRMSLSACLFGVKVTL